MNFSKKRILITGGSSGIGKAVALRMAELGASVVVVGRDLGRLHEVQNQLSVVSDDQRHELVVADLAGVGSSELSEKLDSPVDVVIHSAGVNTKSPLKFISSEKLDSVFGINTFAPMLLMQSLVKKKMINKGGSVVFVSSIASDYATLSNGIYAASKGAIDSFVRIAALELASQGIRVNAVSPGLVDSRMQDAYLLEEAVAEFSKQIPLGRMGKVEDVAESVVFLASESAAWVTGINLVVDGGTTLR